MRIVIAALAVALALASCKQFNAPSRPHGADPVERSGDIDIASD